MSDASGSSTSSKGLLLVIGFVLAVYLAAAAFQIPQYGAALVVAGGSHEKTAAPAAVGGVAASAALAVLALAFVPQ